MPANVPLRFYTAEKLGNTQSLTPDGFLLCEAVPLARTGVLLYSDGEVPVDPDSEGLIRVIREPEEVFSPTAVASFAGKPVTNDHPPTKVTPENWREYAVGVVLNPRRGDGRQYDNDFLFADLLIHDEDAIRDIREGKREVSAGYDADYEQLKPGEGRQHLIVGNHVALVESGRCGPRCAIGDRRMAAKNRPAWIDRVMKAHRTGDSEVLVDELEKVQGMLGEVLSGDEKTVTSKDAGVHVHLHSARDDDDEEEEGKPGGAKAGGGESTGGGAGGGGAEILQRLEALERAVAILARGDDDDEEDKPAAKDKKTKDRRTRDEDRDDDEEDEDEDDRKKKAAKDTKRTRDEDRDDEDEDDDDKKESKDAKRTRDARKGSKDETEYDDPQAGRSSSSSSGGSNSTGKGEVSDRAAVGDSASLRAPWQELLARAEVLAPGIRLPTFDAKQSARVTFDAMCSFRRKVLTEAWKEDDTRVVIEKLGGESRKIPQMTCDAVAMLFNASSEMVRQSNTKRTQDFAGATDVQQQANASLHDTVKMINQRNRERYGVRA